MAWKEETAMSNKKLFVTAAIEKKTNFSALCKQFNISRECGYKWLKRYRQMGTKGLEERSRRPFSSPRKTTDECETQILEVRNKYPAWGSKKIHAYLKQRGILLLPTPSTITRILHRHFRISEKESNKHRAFLRFEHALPNQLWQMDFKGHFETKAGRCNPLTILDDHSRFSLCVQACKNQQGSTVEKALINVFREHGLPERMTMDNGSPWSSPGEVGFTALEVWLIRLGIRVSHSRPYHPQTQGKDERFHRSLKEELLDRKTFQDLEEAQQNFNEWRWSYNNERPHEALGLQAPASRYQNSPRRYPEQLPYIDYDTGSLVRKVNGKGEIYFKGDRYFISTSMIGLLLKLTESERDGIMEVYLVHQRVKEIDLINKKAARKIT